VAEPASDRAIVVAAFAAVALFVLTWSLLHFGFYRHKTITDTGVYQRYGHDIAHGQLPYRDFKLEYPPGALPVFAVPGLISPGSDGEHLTRGFRRTFETIMWVCGAVALCAMAFILRELRAGVAATWAALLLAALAPLALGSVILSRFDLWPAALTTVALAALVGGRVRSGHALLGFAAAAKFYPGVLLPLALAYVWRRRSLREALSCLAWAVGVFAAVFLPFVALSPGGVWHSVSVQLGRPLQVESLGAGLLLAAHHLFGIGVTGETSHGSQNLAGSGADAVGIVTTVAQAAILIWIWVTFARGPATKELLVRASVACVCAFIAFGKVLSPQFLIWLIPVVPLVRGRRGVWASALLVAALVLTQIWFPFRYFRLSLDFEEWLSWVLLARDLALVALSVLLVASLRHRHA
jgi:glycosyl transferase family 87